MHVSGVRKKVGLCTRCEEPVTADSSTGLCQRCSASLVGSRYGASKIWIRTSRMGRGRGRNGYLTKVRKKKMNALLDLFFKKGGKDG